MKTLRLGLVGLPNTAIAAELQKPIAGLKLAAVADPRDPPMALIARQDIDAVVLTAPVTGVVDLIEAAAASGKHVLIAGPISTNRAEADRVVTTSWKVKVLAGYLPRFASANREVRDAIKRGAIGRLTSGFYSTHAPIDATGDGTGFFDHVAPFADLFRWISGSEPRSVMATIGTPIDPTTDTDRYGMATFTMANGATLTLESTTNRDANPVADRATIVGTKGEIEFRYRRSPQIEIQGSEAPWRRRRYLDAIVGDLGETAYRNLLTEFRDTIVEDREPSPSASDARAALEMILAAQEATRTGRRVTFPLKGALESAKRARLPSPSSQAFAWLGGPEVVHAR